MGWKKRQGHQKHTSFSPGCSDLRAMGPGGKEGERTCILMGSDKEDELPLTSVFPTDRPSGEEVSFAMHQPEVLGTLSQVIL